MAKNKPTRTELLTLALEMCERDEDQGVCLECGEIADGIEPDARRYHCDACATDNVYGREEVLEKLS